MVFIRSFFDIAQFYGFFCSCMEKSSPLNVEQIIVQGKNLTDRHLFYISCSVLPVFRRLSHPQAKLWGFFCIVLVQSRQYDTMINSITSMLTPYFFPLSIAPGNILFHAELLKNIVDFFKIIVIFVTESIIHIESNVKMPPKCYG